MNARATRRPGKGTEALLPPPAAPQPGKPAVAALTTDAPMPTVENDPPCVFNPASGIGSADVLEVALMYLIVLTNSPIQLERGALRALLMPSERVAQLSDSARRFMTPTTTN